MMIPKTLKSCNLQLITPCLCAGADQQSPELRAASFRGELRWWFRCLGGTREQENSIFGGVHGDCKASAVALLVQDVKGNPDFEWTFEKPQRKGVNSCYITYFLDAGKDDAAKREDAYLPPGIKFTLELRQLRELAEDEKELLLLAWDCLCNLGGIGARKTRALGAYAPVNPDEQRIPALLNHDTVKKHFTIKYFEKSDFGDFSKVEVITKLLTFCAQKLKEYRKNYKLHPTLTPGQKPAKEGFYGISALGNAINGRQASAVRFRPVLVNNKLQLCILKAPDITLSPAAKMHNIDKL